MGYSPTIRQARERIGIEVAEAAIYVGISKEHFWDLESDDGELRMTLSLGQLHRLCNLLHLTAHDLLGQRKPQRQIHPLELREHVLQDCRRRHWSAAAFSDAVGWDVQGLIATPEAFVRELNVDGLQDICSHLGIDPMEAVAGAA